MVMQSLQHPELGVAHELPRVSPSQSSQQAEPCQISGAKGQQPASRCPHSCCKLGCIGFNGVGQQYRAWGRAARRILVEPEHWQLEAEASKLEALTRSLQDTGLPSGPAMEKLTRLKRHIRSLQPQGQQVDTLTAQIRKTQKLRETAVAQQEELQKKLKDLAEKVEKHSQEEAALQEELEAVRKEVASETVLDSSDPAAEVKIALDIACQDLRAAVTVPDNTQGQQLMERMDAVLWFIGEEASAPACQPSGALEETRLSPSPRSCRRRYTEGHGSRIGRGQRPRSSSRRKGGQLRSSTQSCRAPWPLWQVSGLASSVFAALLACLQGGRAELAVETWSLSSSPPLACFAHQQEALDAAPNSQLVDGVMCSSWHQQFSAVVWPQRAAVQLLQQCFLSCSMNSSAACNLLKKRSCRAKLDTAVWRLSTSLAPACFGHGQKTLGEAFGAQWGQQSTCPLGHQQSAALATIYDASVQLRQQCLPPCSVDRLASWHLLNNDCRFLSMRRGQYGGGDAQEPIESQEGKSSVALRSVCSRPWSSQQPGAVGAEPVGADDVQGDWGSCCCPLLSDWGAELLMPLRHVKVSNPLLCKCASSVYGLAASMLRQSWIACSHVRLSTSMQLSGQVAFAGVRVQETRPGHCLQDPTVLHCSYLLPVQKASRVAPPRCPFQLQVCSWHEVCAHGNALAGYRPGSCDAPPRRWQLYKTKADAADCGSFEDACGVVADQHAVTARDGAAAGGNDRFSDGTRQSL